MSHHHRGVCLSEKEGDDDPRPPPLPNRDLIAPSNTRSITPNVAVRPPSLSLEESIHCFRAISYRRPLPSSQNQRRPKARLTEAEKTKVLGVRRQGACLRCRMLKIECSLQNPCQPCLQSAVKGTERKVLSFSYCVRTRFADVNIFLDPCSATPAFKMRTETLMLKMSNLLLRIATPAQFSFLEDKAAFNKTMTSWLNDPNFSLGGGSMVGLCCSNLLALRFAEGEGEGEKDLREVGKEFQQFLLATSLAHTGSGSAKGMNPLEVGLAGQVSGSRLLLRLDRILTPQYLAKLSRSSCQVLFLFVLGAVLGVGYSTSSAAAMKMQSPDFPAEMLDEQMQQSPTLWLAMREHLCQMLAHHLIYLGGMLGIKLETGMERRIIECAGKGWGKTLASTTPAAPQKQHYDWEGGYVWGDGIIPETENQGQEERGLSGEQEHGWTGEEDNLNPKYWDDDAEMTDNNTTTPVPRPSELPPPPPPLVPIACGPELSHFKNYEHNCDWDQNPASYLEMSEPETYYTPTPASQAVAGEKRAFPSVSRARTEPYFRSQDYDIPRERKRRTMWIVRSVDAGPEAGHINVHARLRRGRDMEGLRSFV